MKVFLRKDIKNELIKLAKESYPIEVCSFLLGNCVNKDEYYVEQIYTMKNDDNSHLSFHIDEKSLFELYSNPKVKDKIIGIFHSHPSGVLPSQTDEKYMQINPVIWIIFPVVNDKLRAYFYENNIIVNVELDTVTTTMV